jgi:hypothetical protein
LAGVGKFSGIRVLYGLYGARKEEAEESC